MSDLWEGLRLEMRRIELLCACATLARDGTEVSAELRAEVEGAGARVRESRSRAAWCELASAYRLDPLDLDLLFCCVAPCADSSIGWAFQAAQGPQAGPHASPALVRELFFMDERDSARMLSRLAASAPLVRSGLLRPHGGGFYQPIEPGSLALELLLGWPALAQESPAGAILSEPRGSWDDLVLPAHCRERLMSFLDWIRHRARVFGEWGAEPTGGPIALFSGPPGTGKSFAASVIASALGWPLFRVDLGAVVSKYIGETEKNLNAIFEAAAGRKALLLFDEADALFGKRAEVRDARDRYANMEVSHLLTRIELHDGPCILTTNLRPNIDAAFARRFHVTVDFTLPDESLRAALWRRYLPPRAPYAADVRPETLAAAVKLSGSQIRNAAVQAAFLAAAENASAIGYEHLARATWSELQKEGRELGASRLGALAAHLSSSKGGTSPC